MFGKTDGGTSVNSCQGHDAKKGGFIQTVVSKQSKTGCRQNANFLLVMLILTYKTTFTKILHFTHLYRCLNRCDFILNKVKH